MWQRASLARGANVRSPGSSTGLPRDVDRFIARYIRSVEMLEILLLIRRERRRFDAEQVARELRVDPRSAARRLQELASHSIATRSGDSYEYSATGELDRDVSTLAHTYGERRVAVITCIATQPNDQLRSFADAFRFRGGN